MTEPSCQECQPRKEVRMPRWSVANNSAFFLGAKGARARAKQKVLRRRAQDRRLGKKNEKKPIQRPGQHVKSTAHIFLHPDAAFGLVSFPPSLQPVLRRHRLFMTCCTHRRA